MAFMIAGLGGITVYTFLKYENLAIIVLQLIITLILTVMYLRLCLVEPGIPKAILDKVI